MKTTDLAKVRNTLWAAADELRANSKLTPVQYRNPVLGLVFLAYAENRFEAVRGEVESKASARNPAAHADYKAKSVLY
ncbi:MAG: type I restriction-modification system subunit M N-terminal domain-containing protein, partial [Mycobacterium sp.]